MLSLSSNCNECGSRSARRPYTSHKKRIAASATGLRRKPAIFAPEMKQKEYLPFFGIGPYYVGTIAILTAVGMILSKRGYLDSGLIPELKTPMLIMGILLILPFIFWGLMAVMMKLTEEKWLHNLYGAEYDAYCRRVNRVWPWFPQK